MSLWHWTQAGLAAILISAGTLPSSEASSAQAQAEVLWEDGRDAFLGNRHADAAPLLKQYIDRHAGAPGFTEAHWLLAQSYFHLGEIKKSLPLFRYFINARPSSLNSEAARLQLGDAYLALGKYNEARLIADEVIGRKSRPNLTPELRLSADVIKAEALMGLKRDSIARQSVETIQKEMDSLKIESSALSSRMGSLLLQIKAKECSALPGKGALDEGQVKNLLSRKSICLMEASHQYMRVLKIGATPAAERSATIWKNLLQEYSLQCENPPPAPGKRSKAEKKQYRQELIAMLTPECHSNLMKIKTFMGTSQAELPTETQSQVELGLQELRGWIGRFAPRQSI